MLDDSKSYYINELYFSREAASYLGISAQRLSQLVHDGKLIPVKRTAGCLLFSKEDLDLRKVEMNSIALRTTDKNRELNSSSIITPTRQEAISYFTIQSFLKYSDKRTSPVFDKLSETLNFSKELDQNGIVEISRFIKITPNELKSRYEEVKKSFFELQRDVIILKADDQKYPKLLKSVQDHPPFIFLRGNMELLNSTVISVVGSRKPSEQGSDKAYKISQLLGRSGIVVAAGLAKGIDTQAHKSAIDSGRPTIAVIGTPINRVYPRENKTLQERIVSSGGLVISQFGPNENIQRWFFPLRNGTMSAISRATVIVEAGETSGALKQADYAVKQGRLVFIPQSAFDNRQIKWPEKYIVKPGVYQFSKIKELLNTLNKNKILSDVVTAKGMEQLGLFEE